MGMAKVFLKDCNMEVSKQYGIVGLGRGLVNYMRGHINFSDKCNFKKLGPPYFHSQLFTLCSLNFYVHLIVEKIFLLCFELATSF